MRALMAAGADIDAADFVRVLCYAMLCCVLLCYDVCYAMLCYNLFLFIIWSYFYFIYHQNGYTAFLWACYKGNLEVVNLLVDAGASIANKNLVSAMLCRAALRIYPWPLAHTNTHTHTHYPPYP
jgi:ankyrin repeat protein